MRQHFGINQKRAQRLMRLLGLEAAQPRRSTSRPAPGHKVYPFAARNMAITGPDQVWATDITSIPLQHGFMYLTAVMDMYSRNVPKRSACGTMPMAGRPRNRLESTSPSHEPSGLIKPAATADQWRSIGEGDATNAFALIFPLRRTRNERMSIGNGVHLMRLPL